MALPAVELSCCLPHCCLTSPKWLFCFSLQDLLLQRNALLERAYAMVSGGQQGIGGFAGGGDVAQQRRNSGGVRDEATAWWLTDEMQARKVVLLVSSEKFSLFPVSASSAAWLARHSPGGSTMGCRCAGAPNNF